MTIGIGLSCRDGAVLCADTEITAGDWYKRRASKITTVSELDNRLIFTQADVIDAGKILIEKLAWAVRDKQPGTLRETKELLRLQCKEFRKEEKVCPQLIIIYRLEKRVFLFAVEGFRLIDVNDIRCIGSGSLVVQRVIENYYEPRMSVRQATFAAAYAAKEAKDYGLYVGGRTQIVQAFNDGKWDVLQSDEVEMLERDYVKAQELLGLLLTAYTPLFMPESKEFKANLKRLTTHLRRAYKNRGHLAGQRENEEINRRLDHEAEEAGRGAE